MIGELALELHFLERSERADGHRVSGAKDDIAGGNSSKFGGYRAIDQPADDDESPCVLFASRTVKRLQNYLIQVFSVGPPARALAPFRGAQ